MDEAYVNDHIRQVRTALQTDEGKKLLSLLQQDGGKAMEKASAALKRGNCEEAVSQLSPLFRAPNSAKLLQEIGEKLGQLK